MKKLKRCLRLQHFGRHVSESLPGPSTATSSDLLQTIPTELNTAPLSTAASSDLLQIIPTELDTAPLGDATNSDQLETMPTELDTQAAPASSACNTTWEGTKTVLRVIKESADAFPPLKSTAGGLITLIELFEVS